MRCAEPLAVVLLLGACGFDLEISIGMDPRFGSFEQSGMPVGYVRIERWFTSLDAARESSILFEVEDGVGVHTFDLSKLLYCPDDDDPSSLAISFQLTYGNCILNPPMPAGDLHLCWGGSRCGNVTAIPRMSAEPMIAGAGHHIGDHEDTVRVLVRSNAHPFVAVP